MASPFTELEVLTIMFSLLVFALFTLTGMLNEECSHSSGSSVICFQDEGQRSGLDDLKIAAVILPLMDLPFTGFELTFIIVAFVIFSLFSLASIFIKPQAAHSEKCVDEAKKSGKFCRKQRVITKQAGQLP